MRSHLPVDSKEINGCHLSLSKSQGGCETMRGRHEGGREVHGLKLRDILQAQFMAPQI